MQKIIFYISMLALILVGCKSKEEVQKPYVKVKASNHAQLSYFLPKNAFHVRIYIVREQQFKGPFSDYASEYLGIDADVVKYDDVNYELADAEINLHTYPDPAEQYYVHIDDKQPVNINLTSEGILAGVNEQRTFRVENTELTNYLPPVNDFVFTDLSVKPIVDITEEVSYEYKKVDSALVRVPVEKEVTEVKTFQEMAWGAAKFIATLRESRFRLVAGISETDQIPEIIEGRTEELDLLEQKYLELFTGHVIRDTLIYNFLYEPEAGMPEDLKEVLFYFSKSNGIKQRTGGIENDNLYGLGSPVYLNVTPAILPEQQNKQKLEQLEPKGIVYRIPARASLELQINDKNLAKEFFPVAQWGKHSFLPSSMLNESENKVIFDVRTGQILQISEK
ncbi:DUF4831 family protein [Salinivirga cyanobacteriivorans]